MEPVEEHTTDKVQEVHPEQVVEATTEAVPVVHQVPAAHHQEDLPAQAVEVPEEVQEVLDIENKVV